MNPRWRLFGASVSGTSHLKTGIPCQDAHRYVVLDNGVVIAAVADGAGSAKHADRGSVLAVEHAVLWLGNHLSARTSSNGIHEPDALELLRNTACEVRASLERNVDGDDVVLSDFATTLLVCFATKSLIAACQIGDGAIVSITDGDVQTLTQPNHGEYINETTFLTSDKYAETASYVVQESNATNGIFLFTDGIQSLALNLSDYKPHTPFFKNIEQYARSANANSAAVASFLASDRVCERTDDDKTLVIAVR
jgi:serine/threonine protein phosphatase PrpC